MEAMYTALRALVAGDAMAWAGVFRFLGMVMFLQLLVPAASHAAWRIEVRWPGRGLEVMAVLLGSVLCLWAGISWAYTLAGVMVWAGLSQAERSRAAAAAHTAGSRVPPGAQEGQDG